MNTATRLAVAATAPEAGHAGHGTASTGAGSDASLPPGLASSAQGYTLEPLADTLPAQAPTEIAYRIVGATGTPVTGFDTIHEKQMHLIVVRSDTVGFRHLHPTMSPDGTWRAPVALAGAGTWRVFADFRPVGGPATTLGVDLSAPGEFLPADHRPVRVATVEGDYQIRLDGDLAPGRAGDVTLTVTRGGAPVTDLQPYLGAYGHLVALRTGDLAYLHVHPQGSPGDGTTAPGPQIRLAAEVPSAGTYRLFLDFRHQGQVHTAEFTIPTTDPTAPSALNAAAAPTAPAPPAAHAEGGH